MDVPNDIFRKFIPELTAVLQANEDGELGTQKELIAKLLKLEEKFRVTLQSTDKGKAMYQKFIDYIVDEGNSLKYSVYFREDGMKLLKSINPIFEKKKIAMLYDFNINFVFAKWITDRYRGPKKKVLRDICAEMGTVRKTLCEDNLPLAINRAKLFFGKTTTVHLDYMDMIQASAEGLVIAIDKFEPPRGVFAGVAVGRMSLSMRDESSQTLVKLGPKDKRILYRAKIAETKEKLTDEDEIIKFVNQSFKGVTKESLAALVNAATNMVSVDEKREDSLSILEKTASDDNPELETVEMDLKTRLRRGILALSIPERKVVRLKNNL